MVVVPGFQERVERAVQLLTGEPQNMQVDLVAVPVE